MDKRPLIDACIAALTERLETTVAALADAQAGATSDEARPENRYDTRALETSYLAEAHTERVQAMRRTLTTLHFWQPEPELSEIVAGALVQLDGPQVPAWVFVVPCEFSAMVQAGARTVQVVAQSAPLALALLHRVVGDQVRLPGGREAEVCAIDPAD